MNELLWLPTWPSQFSLLTMLALMLLIGGLAARILCPILRIPEISVYLLCGLLLGPTGLSIISVRTAPGIETLANLAMGLVLFELGRRVDLSWLRYERWALTAGITQFICVFTALAAVFLAIGADGATAFMAAALGATASPAIIVRITQETQSEGQVTERLLHAVAIQCLMGFVVFVIGLQVMHVSHTATSPMTLLQPAYLFIGSVLLGWLASIVANRLSRMLKSTPTAQIVLLISLVLLLVEANQLLKLSPLVSILIFGMQARGHRDEPMLISTESIFTNSLVYIFLFVYLGTTIDIAPSQKMLMLGLAIMAVRWLMLVLPSVALARLNGLTLAKGLWLGSAMLPTSTLSVLFLGHASSFYPEFGTEVTRLLGAMLLITYAIGPFVTWWAMRLCGEARRDD